MGANGSFPPPVIRPNPNNDYQQSCNQGQADNCAYQGGVPDPVSCDCDMGNFYNLGYSPILIDLKGNGFELTNLAQGVKFDLNKDGIKEKLSWTKARSDEGFLVLDRNGNGTIDNGTELFGNFTPQPYSNTRNGFAALAVFDGLGKGGNNDGAIDNQDKIYKLLRLWIDYNQNGISESDELIPLKSVGLSALSLNYNSHGAYTDRYGNEFKYRSKVDDTNGTHIGHWAWDVFLLHQ